MSHRTGEEREEQQEKEELDNTQLTYSVGFLVLVFTISKKFHTWYNKHVITTPGFITQTKAVVKDIGKVIAIPPKEPVSEEKEIESKPEVQGDVTSVSQEKETAIQTPLELFNSVAETLLLDDNSPVTAAEKETESRFTPTITETAATATPTTTLSSDHTTQPTTLNAATAPITLSAPGENDTSPTTVITTYTVPEEIVDSTATTAPKALHIVNMPQTALPAASLTTAATAEKMQEAAHTPEPTRIMPSQ